MVSKLVRSMSFDLLVEDFVAGTYCADRTLLELFEVLLYSFAVWYCSSFVLLLAAIVVRSELFNLGFCIFLFFELFVCCCVYNDWKG